MQNNNNLATNFIPNSLPSPQDLLASNLVEFKLKADNVNAKFSEAASNFIVWLGNTFSQLQELHFFIRDADLLLESDCSHTFDIILQDFFKAISKNIRIQMDFIAPIDKLKRLIFTLNRCELFDDFKQHNESKFNVYIQMQQALLDEFEPDLKQDLSYWFWQRLIDFQTGMEPSSLSIIEQYDFILKNILTPNYKKLSQQYVEKINFFVKSCENLFNGNFAFYPEKIGIKNIEVYKYSSFYVLYSKLYFADLLNNTTCKEIYQNLLNSIWDIKINTYKNSNSTKVDSEKVLLHILIESNYYVRTLHSQAHYPEFLKHWIDHQRIFLSTKFNKELNNKFPSLLLAKMYEIENSNNQNSCESYSFASKEELIETGEFILEDLLNKKTSYNCILTTIDSSGTLSSRDDVGKVILPEGALNEPERNIYQPTQVEDEIFTKKEHEGALQFNLRNL